MNKLVAYLFILSAGCITLTTLNASPLGDNKLTLIYSGNLNGELEPCGCTDEGDLGGIRRQATMLRQLRQQHPDLFLISSGGLLAIDSAVDRIKNKYILKGMHKLGYDAIGIQARDLVFGPELLSTASLPWVASNRIDDRFKPVHRITRNKISLSIFSWIKMQNTQPQNMQTKQISSKQALALMRKDIQQAKQQGDLIVLTTAQPLAEIQASIPIDNIDILLIEAAHEVYGPPQQIGHTLILQPGSRGMRLAQADLQLDKQGRIKSYQHQVILLPTSIPEAAEYASWYEDYNGELKQDYLKRVEVRKATETGQSPYAGAEKCQACHQTAYTSWQKSQHAHAMASLQKVDKAFDPNCIGCHSVGFEKAGGFLDEFITEHLMNVQCESCHGAANEHISESGKTPTENKGWSTEKICRQCHIGSHSPSFSVEKYWPKVAH